MELDGNLAPVLPVPSADVLSMLRAIRTTLVDKLLVAVQLLEGGEQCEELPSTIDLGQLSDPSASSSLGGNSDKTLDPGCIRS